MICTIFRLNLNFMIMKTSLSFIVLLTLIMIYSCKKEGGNAVLGGDPSPMAEVGTTVGSTSATVAGVSNFSGTVSSVENGVSVYSGSCTISNTVLKNMLSNIPEITVTGNAVSTTSIKFKQTTDGIEFMSGPTAGIWVKYSSSVGDKYPIGSTGDYRTVVNKSTTDDFPYGYYNIKVIEVEETPGSLLGTGISKITYYANHRFGLVAVKFTFEDQTTALFPVYSSAENS